MPAMRRWVRLYREVRFTPMTVWAACVISASAALLFPVHPGWLRVAVILAAGTAVPALLLLGGIAGVARADAKHRKARRAGSLPGP